jgi:ABC-type glutathione transport system ATPase component
MDDRFDIRVSSGSRLLVDVRGFSLGRGEITLLFGESGIGKSLIGKALFGIVDDPLLRVEINGIDADRYHAAPDVAARKKDGFFVFQEPSSHLNPLATLDAQMREGDLAACDDPVRVVGTLWGQDEQRDLARILPVFPTAYRPSGGEKQRILIGMAFEKMELAASSGEQRRGLFVFDEPTGSLDREARDRFLDGLFGHYRHGKGTVLLITHDYSMIGYVRKRHPAMEQHVSYRELRRDGAGLSLADFRPADYLQWLEGIRPKVAKHVSGPPLLSVESGLRVFGKKLGFHGPGDRSERSHLEIRSGDLVYLKARSGAGKTTVAKIIMGLQRADYFRMNFDGIRLGEVSPPRYWEKKLWGKKMTMVFQHADEALNLKSTVGQSLAILPVESTQTEEGRRGILASLFDDGSLPTLARKRVSYLSGGQKQRLNLLRAFALSTSFLILDEPLNALDFRSITRVLQAIERRRELGQGILLISHNEDIFQALIPPELTYTLVEE